MPPVLLIILFYKLGFKIFIHSFLYDNGVCHKLKFTYLVFRICILSISKFLGVKEGSVRNKRYAISGIIDTFFRHTGRQRILKKGKKTYIIQKAYTVNKTNPQQRRIVCKRHAHIKQ
jgi:hypothetical protein